MLLGNDSNGMQIIKAEVDQWIQAGAKGLRALAQG
jgi:hypothetical protein